MVDCMNKSGINFVSFGNHEADVELKQIHNRIRESNFTWINSNMRDLPLPDDLKAKGLPGYSIIEVAANNHKRRYYKYFIQLLILLSRSCVHLE